MSSIPIYLETTAIIYLGDIEIDESIDIDEAYAMAEELWDNQDVNTTLCHQCSNIELGDFVIDDQSIEQHFL